MSTRRRPSSVSQAPSQMESGGRKSFLASQRRQSAVSARSGGASVAPLPTAMGGGAGGTQPKKEKGTPRTFNIKGEHEEEERVEQSRYTGAQASGMKDLAAAGALTAGVSKSAVAGQAAEEEDSLSALEHLMAAKKAARLEEIAVKLELEGQVDAMTFKKHGILAKLRGGHTLAVADCAYTDDGKYITSCSFDGSVVSYDVKHQKIKRVYDGHVGMVFACQLVPRVGNKLLATAGQDSTVRVWDRKTGKCKLVFKDEHAFSVYTVAWSPDGKRLATAGEDRSIVVWDVTTALECADDPSMTNEAIIDFKMFSYPQNFHGHRGPIRKLLFAREGKALISCSDDGRIKQWKLGASGGGVVSVSLEAHAGGVLDMDLSPDGARFVSCSRDGTIKQWYARSGQQINTLVGHAGSVYCVRYTKERPADAVGPCPARRLISGGHDLAVLVWDAESGAVLQRMAGIHRSYILGLAVKHDGREFATASGDHTVGVWRGVAPTRWELLVESVQQVAAKGSRLVLESVGLADYFTQHQAQAAAASARSP